jgi:hypothetical protein
VGGLLLNYAMLHYGLWLWRRFIIINWNASSALWRLLSIVQYESDCVSLLVPARSPATNIRNFDDKAIAIAREYFSMQQLYNLDAVLQFFECVLQQLLLLHLLPLELKKLWMKKIMQLPVASTRHAIPATQNIQWHESTMTTWPRERTHLQPWRLQTADQSRS